MKLIVETFQRKADNAVVAHGPKVLYAINAKNVQAIKTRIPSKKMKDYSNSNFLTISTYVVVMTHHI